MHGCLAAAEAWGRALILVTAKVAAYFIVCAIVAISVLVIVHHDTI